MWKKVLVTLLVLVLMAFIAKDRIAEFTAEAILSHIAGFRVDIAMIRVGLFRSTVEVQGMKIYNPEEYPYSLMAEIPLIYVDYSPLHLKKGIIHLKELKFDLREFDVVKDREGKININQLRPIKDRRHGEDLESADRGVPDVHIDKLYLRIDEGYYRDYSRHSSQPTVRKFEIGIEEEYNNITDLYTLVRLIVHKSLMDTQIAKMVNVPMIGMKEVLSSASSVRHMVRDTAKNTTEGVGSAVKGAGSAVGGIFSGIGEVLSLGTQETDSDSAAREH